MSWTSSQLKQLRLELGWSQAEMGRRLGMNAKRWDAIELGQVALDPETEAALSLLASQLEDYSKSLSFSSESESYMEKHQLNQISRFDLESFDDS